MSDTHTEMHPNDGTVLAVYLAVWALMAAVLALGRGVPFEQVSHNVLSTPVVATLHDSKVTQSGVAGEILRLSTPRAPILLVLA